MTASLLLDLEHLANILALVHLAALVGHDGGHSSQLGLSPELFRRLQHNRAIKLDTVALELILLRRLNAISLLYGKVLPRPHHLEVACHTLVLWLDIAQVHSALVLQDAHDVAVARVNVGAVRVEHTLLHGAVEFSQVDPVHTDLDGLAYQVTQIWQENERLVEVLSSSCRWLVNIWSCLNLVLRRSLRVLGQLFFFLLFVPNLVFLNLG